MDKLKKPSNLEKYKALIINSCKAIGKALTHENDSDDDVDTSQASYPLIESTATQLDIDLYQASGHPFIKFINGCLKRGENTPKITEKLLANFESFLQAPNTPEITQTFFLIFASKQGLFLYRCQLKNIRYFSKILVKLNNDKQAIQNILTALSDKRLQKINNRDDVLIQILTNQKIREAADAITVSEQLDSIC